MRLLSIETTTSVGSIAIVENFNIIKEITFKSEDVASELVKNLNYITQNFNINNFDYFVVSKGPGSWTGIKTGISFVKGLVCGKTEKIYTVSVPDSLFFILRNYKCKFLCLINAFRGNFYISKFNGKFNYGKNFPIKIVSNEMVKNILKKNNYIPIGPGLDIFPPLKKNNFIFPIYPLASYNAFLSYEKIKRGIKSTSYEPHYGR